MAKNYKNNGDIGGFDTADIPESKKTTKENRLEALNSDMEAFVKDFPPAENIKFAEQFLNTEQLRNHFQDYTEQKNVDLVEMKALLQADNYHCTVINRQVLWMIRNK